MDLMHPLRSRRGAMAKVAAALNLTRGAVVQWRRVPAERVVDVERVTGIPRHELRPDLWEAPKEAAQ